MSRVSWRLCRLASRQEELKLRMLPRWRSLAGLSLTAGLVLIMSAVSAVMIVVFYAVMELLLPQ